MRAGETLELSKHEAKVLGERLGAKGARAAGLDEARTRRLVGLIEAELAAAFERVHGSGDGGTKKIGDEWSSAMDRVREKAKAFMSEDEIARAKAGVDE
jgi:hypothetical protein